MAHFGVHEFHHLFLAFLNCLEELFLSLQVPVYGAVVELDQSHKLSGAAYHQ